MKRAKLLTAFVTFFATSAVAVAQGVPPVSAKNFLRLNDDFCTAGQPSLEDLAKLKAEGIRAILNLRQPEEDPLIAEEEKAAQSLGLKYFNLPIDASNLQTSQAEQFLKIVGDEHNHPILIHCASANRVGGFWMIHRVLKDGWTLEKAEEEARRIGLRNPALVEFARRYIAARLEGKKDD